jgi:outer membrane biosynthesis protein TonB
MRVTAKLLLWLTPMLLLGCGHKDQPAQTQALAPPIVDTPPPKPATVSTADLPPPVIGNTPQPAPPPETPPAPPPKKPVHSKKKTPSSTSPSTAAQTPAATETASTPAPEVSAIGQLSEGTSTDARTRTEESIQNTEKGVNAITRGLTDQELKTIAQIREFLKQAREALTGGDVDGARTLADKAKVLLNELNR